MKRSIAVPVTHTVFLLSFLMIAWVAAASAPAWAADQFSPVDDPVRIQVGSDGVAIGGYDPVAYFDQNAAIKGAAQFNCEYQGAMWHFTSAENRDRFLAAPERFAPQYGGYCAYSVEQNKIVTSNPETFLVRDDKLYLYVTDALSEKDSNKTSKAFERGQSKRDKNWLTFESRF